MNLRKDGSANFCQSSRNWYSLCSTVGECYKTAGLKIWGLEALHLGTRNIPSFGLGSCRVETESDDATFSPQMLLERETQKC